MGTSEEAPFEGVRRQIGLCGIWCGSCAVGNGALRELTGRYAGLIEGYGLKEWAPEGLNYGEFARGLAAIRDMPPCPGCRRGGGRDNCEMRSCATDKGFTDCGECAAGAECSHSELLEHMRAGARDVGLKVKTETGSGEGLIETWTAELRETWPTCMLFPEDE